MRVLVTGATGQLGREVVTALLHADHQVVAITRQPDPTLPGPVEQVTGDLADTDVLGAAGARVDGLFLLAGYTDEAEALRRLADVASAHVVLLSSGCVEGGNLDNSMVRFNTAAEIAVREAGLPWTVLRPSGFMSNTLQWVEQLRAGDTVLEPFPDVAVAMVDPQDIAAVVPVVLDPDHHGRTHRLTGPEALLPSDRVHRLGEVLGRDLVYVPEGDDDAHARMSGSMPDELVDAFFRFYRDGEYDDSRVRPTASMLLGRPPTTFTQWAQEHTSQFT